MLIKTGRHTRMLFNDKTCYMIVTEKSAIQQFMQMVKRRNPDQPEFYQAVYEVAQAIIPFIEEHPEYKKPCGPPACS